MKTIEEIKNGFLNLLENVIENADQKVVSQTEGRNKQEMKEHYTKAYNLFLEKPEYRQNTLSNKMRRLESYLNEN